VTPASAPDAAFGVAGVCVCLCQCACVCAGLCLYVGVGLCD